MARLLLVFVEPDSYNQAADMQLTYFPPSQPATPVPLSPDDCWFEAPAERTQLFYAVFSQVARALHQALRDVMPDMALQDPAAFADTELAYPLLAYRASKPYSCRQRAEFSYDVLNPDRMAIFFYHAKRNLPTVIRQIRRDLLAAELPDLAAQYPDAIITRIMRLIRVQKRHRHPLNQILVVEGRLFDVLVDLAAAHPKNEKERQKAVDQFNKNWNQLLRRFCGSRDFTAAGPVLLQAATNAYLSSMPGFQSPYFDQWAA